MISHVLLAVIILCTLITSTAGAVGTSPIQALQNTKRDEWQPNDTSLACLFLTSETNWLGETQNLCQVGGLCAGLLPDGLSANVSSAGPTDGQTCFLYSAENCTGVRSSPISYPGYADLSGIGFQNKAVSWRCYKWCGYMGTDNASISSSAMASSSSASPASVSSASASSGSVSVVTSTTLITKTVAGSDLIAAIVTDRDVSISTTLSGSQPSYSSGASTSSASISSTISASSATSASTLSPLPSPPAPMVSTTLTSSTSSTASPSSTASSSPLQTLQPMLASSSLSPYSTGNGTMPSTSMFTSTVTIMHTFGGRGSNETALTTFVIVEPVPTTAA